MLGMICLMHFCYVGHKAIRLDFDLESDYKRSDFSGIESRVSIILLISTIELRKLERIAFRILLIRSFLMRQR